MLYILTFFFIALAVFFEALRAVAVVMIVVATIIVARVFAARPKRVVVGGFPLPPIPWDDIDDANDRFPAVNGGDETINVVAFNDYTAHKNNRNTK